MTYIAIPSAVQRLSATLPAGTYSPAWAAKASITVNRTGYWTVAMNGAFNDTALFDFFVRYNYGGTIGTQGNIRNQGATTQWGWSDGFDGGAHLLSNGQVISFEALCGVNAALGGTMWAIFVPTTAYPK